MVPVAAATTSVQPGPIVGVIVGLIVAGAIFAVTRAASGKRDALVETNVGAVVFTVMPFPPVRKQVAALREALHTVGAMPTYGFARPTAVVDKSALSLFMAATSSSNFLTLRSLSSWCLSG